MYGKTCLITGSTSGIGKETALGLAKLGAYVIISGRDQNRGKKIVSEIKKKTGNEDVELMLVDLASQQKIHEFVGEFKNKHEKLHVLINNAGGIFWNRSISVDGFEATLTINYLAPFLLTNLLLDMIKASAPARIVNVTSTMHKRCRQIDFDDLQGEKHYNGIGAYNRSKLLNIHFTYELAERLKGTGVTVNCVHPGFISTKIGRGLPSYFRWGTMFGKSPKKGAKTSIYVASSPELVDVTGKYFSKGKEKRSSKASYNESVRKRLWKIAEELVRLSTT